MTFQKMMLVPVDQANNQPVLPAPAVHHKVSDLDKRLQDILDEKAVSQHEKVRQFRETLDKYLHYLGAANGTHNVTSAKPEPMSGQLPERHTEHDEQNLQDIVSVMAARPDILSYSPNGEVLYHGHPIPGTNILDIIQQQLYPQGPDPPPGNELFTSALDEIREMDQEHSVQGEWEYPNEPLIRETLSRNDIQRILRLERLGRRVKSTTKRKNLQMEEDNDEVVDGPRPKRSRLAMPKLKSKFPRAMKNRRQVPKPKPVHNLSTSRKLEKRSADKVELRPTGPRTKYLKFTPKSLNSEMLSKPKRKQVPAKPAPQKSSRKRSSDKVELRFESS